MTPNFYKGMLWGLLFAISVYITVIKIDVAQLDKRITTMENERVEMQAPHCKKPELLWGLEALENGTDS